MAEEKYVVFRLADERFGLPIESVERILPVQPVTRMPRSPKMMLGVFDLRGSTVPALDGRTRFELPDGAEEGKNFVVLATDEGPCALRVDEVIGILSFDEADTDSAPPMLASRSDVSVKAIGKRADSLTVLLDPALVVPESMRSKVKTLAA